MQVSSNWLALKASGSINTARNANELRGKAENSIVSDRQKKKNIVAMDCEMVEGITIEHMVARVSIVDYDGRVLYDAYVKPQEKVVDYRTSITGITREVLSRKGEPYKTVRDRVMEILSGKIVIGHAIHHDYETLDIPKPSEEFIRDTCLYPGLRVPKRKGTPSLRLLAEYWLEKVVQSGTHSSIEDARTALILFKRFENEWTRSTRASSDETN